MLVCDRCWSVKVANFLTLKFISKLPLQNTLLNYHWSAEITWKVELVGRWRQSENPFRFVLRFGVQSLYKTVLKTAAGKVKMVEDGRLVSII